MSNISININNKEITVPKGYTVMQAAEILDIEIPALCYDPNLEIVGACRLCLVEIEGSNKLQTACSTIAWEGMVVNTESEKVVEARKNVLQLLLDSHPNDCLTCQQAGECSLQKYSYKYDVNFREHDGAMRPKLVDTSSPYIFRDDSKCILCGKCVRTCNEIYDRKVLAFGGRGYDTKVVFDADQTLETSSCISCNRCVVACPVGALVDKRQLGKIREWEADKRVVNCKSCPYGCEFEILSKNDKNIAVRAMEPTNGRPLCLQGRLITELKHLDSPETPYRKIGGEFVESTWIKTLGLQDVMEKIEDIEESQK